METFRKGFGGTAGNIAYSLALLNTPTLLVAAAGNDFDDYYKHLKNSAGLDISGVKTFKDVLTAQGFVTTDRDDNQIWGFYEGAMKRTINIPFNSLLKKDDFAVVAPMDPPSVIKFVRQCVQKETPYLFDPAFNIPHFSLTDLKFAIKNATIIIGNDYEMELIKRRLKIKQFPTDNRIWITTLGSRGSLINQGKNEFKIPSAKPLNTSDPTGAGDAYRSGFLAGFVKGLPLDVCGRMGALASVYTVEKYGTQTHKYTISNFKSRYKNNFGKKLDLEI